MIKNARLAILVGLIPFLCALAMPGGIAAGALTVTDSTCEYSREPLGIDAPRPHLGWVLHSDQPGDVQSAYRVLVASSPGKLAKDEGDLWDSGKVESNQSVQVAYGGRALQSRLACYWKVRAWDKAKAVSEWSWPATWEMGLLAPQDWQAQWLNDGKPNPQRDEDFYREDPAPLFRKEFALTKHVRRARLFISGLGYYEASLNGRRVGDRELEVGDGQTIPGFIPINGRAIGDHLIDPGWTALLAAGPL